MELTVLHYSPGTESTLGLFFIDSKFSCYTLEDQTRDVKVYGKTRIRSGRYQVKLSTEGSHHLSTLPQIFLQKKQEYLG